MPKLFAFVLIMILAISCAKNTPKVEQPITNASTEKKAKATFIELGSTTCVPCIKMKDVMKNIETKYGEQLKVIFYDIKNAKDKSEQYKVRLIPTQVFLDSNGVEFHRHEGYYPENEIDSVLKTKGLISIKN